MAIRLVMSLLLAESECSNSDYNKRWQCNDWKREIKPSKSIELCVCVCVMWVFYWCVEGRCTNKRQIKLEPIIRTNSSFYHTLEIIFYCCDNKILRVYAHTRSSDDVSLIGVRCGWLNWCYDSQAALIWAYHRYVYLNMVFLMLILCTLNPWNTRALNASVPW